MRFTSFALALSAALALGASPAAGQPRDISVQQVQGERRVALVIGNSRYDVAPLNNPVNDARAITGLLQSLGFEVLSHTDLDLVGMRRALADFGERMSEGGVALFYYSGHGLQVGGKNYLIPLGARLTSERYVAAETAEVDAVLKEMDAARNRLNVLILDACRDNPFARGWRSAARGLAQMSGPPGTLIAYATDPGDVAADGKPGTNGVYTAELLRALPEPGLKIEDTFKRAARGVFERTRGRQRPWFLSSFTGDFMFVLPPGESKQAVTPPATVPTPPAQVPPVVPAPPLPPAQPPVPTTPPQSPARTGDLDLTSEPSGATVKLDGEVLGVTPLTKEGLPAGTYTLELEKDGTHYAKRQITVTPNTLEKHSLRLDRVQGKLTVFTEPRDATALIDGVSRGITPLSVDLEVGSHTLRLTKEGYRVHEEPVTIEGHRETRTRVTLRPTRGTLELTSAPQGASVETEGQLRGQTPLTLTLEEGTYRVDMKLGGHRPETRRAEVVGGQRTLVAVTLRSTIGVLEVMSNPAGAVVEIADQARGHTPLRVSLEEGSYRIRLRLPKHKTETRQILHQGERTTRLSIDLTPGPGPGEIERRGTNQAEMVFIPAGTFTMGDTHGDGYRDERPTHRVIVVDFWLDRTEVTNAQFARFIQAGNTAQGEWRRYAIGKDQHPVVSVTWHDAAAYCRWADKRLPTEAEWEYAARGTDGRKYPWGSIWEDSRARSSGNRGNQTTTPVGSYPSGASAFGALDLAGNVWEWTSTVYKPYPYAATDGREDPSASRLRVSRGGSWSNDSWYLRSANRIWIEPSYRNDSLGFRCAQDAKDQEAGVGRAEEKGDSTKPPTPAVASPRPSTGILTITGSPSEAAISLDGKPQGVLKDQPRRLQADAGVHILRLEAPGYKPQETQVTVRADAEHSLRVDLDRLPGIVQPGTIQRRGTDQAEMAYIPGDTFTMGDTHGDGDLDEKPAHQVTLVAFWLDKTEVTNAQFAHFVQSSTSTPQGNLRFAYIAGEDQHPVAKVTWHDAVAYCIWAGKRLPTEAEWEYAARGTDGRRYPWGNQWDGTRARHSGNQGNETTAAVGSYPPGASFFGILDMAGNVWEWTSTIYNGYPYSATDSREDPNALGQRVIRGGSWDYIPMNLRSTFRGAWNPASRRDGVGFRCAQDVKEQESSTPIVEAKRPGDQLKRATKAQEAQPPSQGPRLEPETKVRARQSVAVPAASLTGSNWSSRVAAFRMESSPVSNREFLEFVRSNPQWKRSRIAEKLHDGDYLKHWKDDETVETEEIDRPVRYVSYFAAEAYCRSGGKKLPSLGQYRAASNFSEGVGFVTHDALFEAPDFGFMKYEWTTSWWTGSDPGGRIVYRYGYNHCNVPGMSCYTPLTESHYTGRSLGFRCAQ